jgi:DNA-directed RNA polymerase subunit RPC12/RpoP
MPDAKSALQGLTCPKCGGVVPIPEGQVIVKCPYCDQRSVVKGERGVRRYQVPNRIDRQQALDALGRFLSGNMAIGRDVRNRSKVSEAFIAYLPFWMAWGRVLAWVFGEKEVGSGDHRRYEPREIKVVEDMTWNGAAVDVGEFGVTQVPLSDQQIEPFNPDTLHRLGLVFEPVGSNSNARSAADKDFRDRIRSRANLSRLSQVFARIVRPRLGLVSYPLWVLRYVYRERTFQVVVDGYAGKVLFGKAPGNTLYRAAMLVGGISFGAVIAINLPALILSASSSHSDNPFVFAIGAFAVGIGLMWAGFRAFRYGEEYIYRSGPKNFSTFIGGDTLKDIGSVVSVLEKFR